jgi:ribosome-associated protein
MIDREELVKIVNEHAAFTFSRSSGSGGQNVNKVNTKVLAVLPLSSLTMLTPAEAERIRSKLKRRINKNNELFIAVQEERTQSQNKNISIRRMAQLVIAALRTPKKRKKTRVPARAHVARLEDKSRQTRKKTQRRPASDQE